MSERRQCPLRFVAVVTAAVALAACAETELAGHLATSLEGDSSPGEYKVGNPYQINGIWYTPQEDFYYDEVGEASWYGPGFHGRTTANGERFDQDALTAAHPTLQMPTMVRVTNLNNGRSLVLRVNDRGPFAHNRIIDVSRRAADLLGFREAGTAEVRVQVLSDESIRLAEASGRSFSEGPPPGASRPQVAALPQAPTVAEPVRSPAPSIAATSAAAPASGVFVQAGAFANYGNARRLVGELSGLGTARISDAMVGDVTFYRVQLGPYADAGQASRVLSEVLAAGHSDARLVQN